MLKITLLILVQLVSLFGTNVSDFALNLYLYSQSKSLFYYSMFAIFIILPELALAPVIGIFVDKYNKKILMLLGHGGAGLCSVIILLFLENGHVYTIFFLILIALASIFSSLVFLSLNIVISKEIKKENMNKFASLIQFGFALIFIAGPLVSATLLDKLGVKYVFYLDICTFMLALIYISFMKFNKSVYENNTKIRLKNMKTDLIQAWQYLRKNNALFLSLVLFAFINFSMSLVSILITPLVLDISNIQTLGRIMSISGIGMLVGAAIMFAFKTKKYLFYMVILTAILGLILFLAFLHVDVWLIGIGAFLFMLVSSVINTLNYTFWQVEIDDDLKGRLFGLRNSIMAFSLILGYSLSSFISDVVMPSVLKYLPFLNEILGTFKPAIKLSFIFDACILVGLALIIALKVRKYKNA